MNFLLDLTAGEVGHLICNVWFLKYPLENRKRMGSFFFGGGGLKESKNFPVGRLGGIIIEEIGLK